MNLNITLNVNKRVLRTDAMVVDSFLGQGEALDCYNMKLQDAAASNAYLENEKLQQALAIIEGITDPAQKATLYKKVFTECCDVAQSGCGYKTAFVKQQSNKVGNKWIDTFSSYFYDKEELTLTFHLNGQLQNVLFFDNEVGDNCNVRIQCDSSGLLLTKEFFDRGGHSSKVEYYNKGKCDSVVSFKWESTIHDRLRIGIVN